MTEFNENSLDALTKLSRIECTEEEKQKLLVNIHKMLAYIKQLDEIDVTGVNACESVLEQVANVMRDDVVGELLPREIFLANAPSHVGGMIRVPPVIKFSNP